MSALSDTQKVKICKDFMQSAPPGEFNDVFNDVRVLLGDDALLEAGALQAAAAYNRDHLLPVDLPDGSKAMITEHAEIDEGTYLDPRKSQTFSFDHLKKEASNLQPAEEDPTAAPWRKAVESSVDLYIGEHYPTGMSVVYGSSEGGDAKVVVCIESHKFAPNNYCNGRWRSTWSATVRGSSAEVTGMIQVLVHYYEDGNVQLTTSRDFKETIPAASEKGLAEGLVKLIGKLESDYQTALNENYATMSDTTFKFLRRALPLTRTKIDWTKIASYRVGQEMNKN
eukprot:comp19332_c0_seq1/m.22246 comp19332_c0_seq1/g.22246  ORF comp19332_c0_seq1/g.22246 comp19332_c0_seq1/m.22246 type:complete len:282 (-) comp19332_c0_seq1:199-1044(-)